MAIIRAEEAGQLLPLFEGKRGRFLFRVLERITGVRKLNRMEDRLALLGHEGPDAALDILEDLEIDYAVGHPERLLSLPEGPFITVSNHVYGHLDGIMLLDLIGHQRSDYKVMVNAFLMWIRQLAPSFIAVNPTEKRSQGPTSQSISGVREALGHVHDGGALHLFPSGAVSDLKPGENWTIRDREWQDPAIRLIQKAGVPVVPIRFFDRNSLFYYSLGLIEYRIRFARLFHEMFNKRGTHPRLAIGETIPAEVISETHDLQQLKALLRESVYGMSLPEEFTLRSSLR